MSAYISGKCMTVWNVNEILYPVIYDISHIMLVSYIALFFAVRALSVRKYEWRV